MEEQHFDIPDWVMEENWFLFLMIVAFAAIWLISSKSTTLLLFMIAILFVFTAAKAHHAREREKDANKERAV